MLAAVGMPSRGTALTHVAVLALVTLGVGALAHRRLTRNG